MGTIQIDGSTPKLTIGNATAEDALILFDGNAQDFYIGLDDSADDLIIGLGSAVGTTPAISINEDRDVTISDGAIDFDVASHDGSNGLKLGGTLVTTTAAEINLIDGGTARGTTAIADGDGVLINDAGTMRQTTVETLKTYIGGVTLSGSENNNIATVTGANALIGEARLYYDGDVLWQEASGSTTEFRQTVDGAGTYWSSLIASASNVKLYTRTASPLILGINNAEKVRIDSNGHFFACGKTSTDIGALGSELLANGQANFITDGNIVVNVNRETDDGNLVQLLQDNALHGTIAVSGSTVSYNAFCGSHWSRLADNSKPTILRGTVMESIATMVDWYQAEFDIGGGKMRNEPITLDGRAVGDTFTHTWTQSQQDPKETFIATIVKEDNEQLPKCKISDTADSKAVYGVFMNWDDNDDGTTGVNDMSIASLGAFVVRVHKDETVAIGNWLVSKGDGTAKVLAGSTAITADVQSSLIGKVTSTTKTHIHADDSYCVPCTLHCG
jgi:hypothetical protein